MRCLYVRSKVKIDVKTILSIFCLLMFARPFTQRVLRIPYWNQLANCIIILIDLWIVVQLFAQGRKKTNLLILWCILFYGWFVISTLLFNSSMLWNAVERCGLAVSFVLLLEYMFETLGARRTLPILMIFMEILHYGNLLSMVIYPNGMYHTVNYGTYEATVPNTVDYVRTATSRVHWLLGHQTCLSRFILPAIAIGMLYTYAFSNNRRIVLRTKLLMVACLAELIIARSATNYITMVIVIISLLFLRLTGGKIKFRSWYFIPIIILVYLFLMRSNSLEWLTALLSNIIDRDVELSSRVNIWIQSLFAFLRHPLFGNGYLDESSATIWKMLGDYANPHSTYFWILFEGGIIGMSLFIFLFMYSFRNIRQYGTDKIKIILFAIVIAMLATMVTDDYLFRDPFILILFVICSHALELSEIVTVYRKIKERTKYDEGIYTNYKYFL